MCLESRLGKADLLDLVCLIVFFNSRVDFSLPLLETKESTLITQNKF